MPPGWLVQRMRVEERAFKSGQLLWAKSWVDAKHEAMARRVPILVVILGPDVEQLPSVFYDTSAARTLNESVVALAYIEGTHRIDDYVGRTKALNLAA